MITSTEAAPRQWVAAFQKASPLEAEPQPLVSSIFICLLLWSLLGLLPGFLVPAQQSASYQPLDGSFANTWLLVDY